MAQVYGHTGVSPRMLAERRQRILKIVLMFTAAAAIYFLIATYNMVKTAMRGSYIAALIVLVPTGVIFFFFIRSVIRDIKEIHADLTKRTKDAIEGAWAEEMIGALLAKLPDDYAVFHGVPCPGGDIDHVVVGKTGLFVIETKSHSGRVVVEEDILLNDHPFEKDILHQVLDSAKWLEEMLLVENGLEIRPMRFIVFTRAFVELKSKPPYKGVFFMHRSFMLKQIRQNEAGEVPVTSIIDVLKRKMSVETPSVADAGTNQLEHQSYRDLR